MMKNLKLMVVFGVIILQPQTSYGSGCLREVVRKIDIDPSTMCWKYEGAGTHFKGSFKKGDVVTASGRGKESWDMTVNGPRDFIVLQEPDKPLVFTVPRDGTYDVSMGPCSEWGKPGKVSICLQRSNTDSRMERTTEVLTEDMLKGRWGHASLPCSDSREIESANFYYDGHRYVNEGHDCMILSSRNDGLVLRLEMRCDYGNGKKYKDQKVFKIDLGGRIRKDGSQYKRCG